MRDIQPEDTIFAIEDDYDGRRVVHFLGYGYRTDSSDEHDCRFLEYTGFYIPFPIVLDHGLLAVESEHGEYFTQYVTDCTFDEMMDMYHHYNDGECPTPVEALTADLPNGTYVFIGQ